MAKFLKTLGAAALFSVVCGHAAWAAPTPPDDPAAQTIFALDEAFLSSMKSPQTANEVLTDAVDAAFNIEMMTRFVVGSHWQSLTAPEQTQVSESLRAYLIARLGDAFRGYSGETFAIDPDIAEKGPDKLVKTTISAPGEDPDRVNYRMRQNGDKWLVIDIYYNGVSDLATQRAQIAEAAKAGGGQGIINEIKAATAKLK